MKHISHERKAKVLAKLLPPYNMSVATVSQMEGIQTLWLHHGGGDQVDHDWHALDLKYHLD